MNEKTVTSLQECITILGKLLDDDETKDDGMMCLKYFDSMILAMQVFATNGEIINARSVLSDTSGVGTDPATHNEGCNCGSCAPGTGPLVYKGPRKEMGEPTEGMTQINLEEFKDKPCDCGKSSMEVDSEGIKKCDNSCRESEIESTKTVGEYLNFLSGDEEEPEDLSEVADSVSKFVDDQLFRP